MVVNFMHFSHSYKENEKLDWRVHLYKSLISRLPKDNTLEPLRVGVDNVINCVLQSA
jgi:hypothetical protein